MKNTYALSRVTIVGPLSTSALNLQVDPCIQSCDFCMKGRQRSRQVMDRDRQIVLS